MLKGGTMSRKLDVAVAEVLGYKVVWVDEYLSEFMESTKHKVPVINYVGNNEYDYIPHYSTDGNDMLELVRELQERGFSVELYANNNNTDGMAFCSLYDSSTEEWSGLFRDVAMPKVLAKAFYKAKTGKEWEDD